jgi:hypothetical protein
VFNEISFSEFFLSSIKPAGNLTDLLTRASLGGAAYRLDKA